MSNFNTDEEKNSPSAKDQEQGAFPLFTPQFQTDSDKPPSSDLVATFGDPSAVPPQQSGWGDSFKSTSDDTKPKEMRDKWATTPPSAGLWSNVPPANPSHSGSTIGLAFGAFNPAATSGQAVLAADPLTLNAAEGRSLITGHVDLATLICKPSEIGQKASTQKKQPGAPNRADAAQAQNNPAAAPSSNARATPPANRPTPEQTARARDGLHPANPITAGSRNPTPDAPAPVAPPLPPKPSAPPTPNPVAPPQPDPAPYAAAIQNQFSNQQDLLASPPAPPLAPQQAGLEKSFFDERPEGIPVRQAKTSERFAASRRLTDEPAKPDLKTTVPNDNSGAEPPSSGNPYQDLVRKHNKPVPPPISMNSAASPPPRHSPPRRKQNRLRHRRRQISLSPQNQTSKTFPKKCTSGTGVVFASISFGQSVTVCPGHL